MSRPVAPEAVRRAFDQARCALEATALSNGAAPDVASHEDLGAFTLLLSVQDDEALRTYADNLLAPIEDGEGEHGPELLRSLEAFIERNGQWERAARDLYCHRHTLRYRIKPSRSQPAAISARLRTGSRARGSSAMTQDLALSRALQGAKVWVAGRLDF